MNRLALGVLGLFLPAPALAQDAAHSIAQGDAAKAHGDYKSALAAYTQAIAQAPQDERAYILRGSVRAKLGDNDGAIADDTAALALQPKSAMAMTNRGNARAAKGDLAGAQADYTAALALDPGHVDAYLNRGNIESMHKNYAAALSDYNAALALDPNNALAHYDRAGARRALGKYVDAAADYSQVILANPKDVRAYLNRAVLRLAQRNWHSADADLQHGLSLVPPEEQIYPRLYLWVAGIKAGDPARATQDLQTYHGTLSKTMAVTWPARIESFLLGEMTEPQLLALADIAQAEKNKGQLAQVYYYAGLKRQLAHDPAGAHDFFQKCVASGDPKLHEVILAREELKDTGVAR